MIRRILAAALVVLGLVSIGLGVASATVWSSSDTVTATMPADLAAPVVIVQPGVLGLVAENVTVTASAPSADAPVVLTFAPAGDVMAWVGAGAHVQVTGLTSWDELRAAVIEGESTVPNPAGADLWTTEITGTGEVVVELTPDTGYVAMLAATDGTLPAPRLTLSWAVPVANPYLVPLLVAGAVLLLLGLALLAYDLLVRREVRVRTDAREARRAADATSTSQLSAEGIAAVGGSTPSAEPAGSAALSDTALTRRQLREIERRRRQEDPRLAGDGPVAASGGTAGAGVVPAALDPERHRALRYVEMPGEAPVPEEARTDAEDAGPARGSAIVPGVREPSHHRENEPERTSWRALWGFGEEEQR